MSRRRWAGWVALGLVLTLVLVFFWRLLFSGLILGRGDTFLYFYPYWQAAAEALAQRRAPLWNPHIFMGAPFVANSQVGFFYPLNWPLWLLFPAPYAVSASVVIHVILAGAGAYVLARRQLALSVAAAALAAVSFALGGYVGAQVEHVNQLQGLAWLPWLLAVAGGGREVHGWTAGARVALLAGAIVALQLLAGHTQSLFISVAALLVFRVGNMIPIRVRAGTAYGFMDGVDAFRRSGDEKRGRGWIASLLQAGAAPVAAVLVALLLGAGQLHA